MSDTWTVSPLRIKGTHRYSFRSVKWANILGVYMAESDELPPRLSYMVMYEDGFIDYIVVSDSNNYEIEALKKQQELPEGSKWAIIEGADNLEPIVIDKMGYFTAIDDGNDPYDTCDCVAPDCKKLSNCARNDYDDLPD